MMSLSLKVNANMPSSPPPLHLCCHLHRYIDLYTNVLLFSHNYNSKCTLVCPRKMHHLVLCLPLLRPMFQLIDIVQQPELTILTVYVITNLRIIRSVAFLFNYLCHSFAYSMLSSSITFSLAVPSYFPSLSAFPPL